jgi:non-lysosomal glucosylceramidase
MNAPFDPAAESAARRARAFAHGATRLGTLGPARAGRPKPGSHDHGPDTGFFFGGIGGPAFSRDLRGRFDRWQLEPGKLAQVPIAAACLVVRWRGRDGRSHARRLEAGSGRDRFPPATRRVAALFPLLVEVYDDPALPFVATLEGFSPIVPGDTATSALPVTLFAVELAPRDGEPLDVGVALFWPNLIGWQLPLVTTAARSGRLWPNHGHAGQIHRAGPAGADRLVVIQSRETIEPDEAMAGEVALAVEAPGARLDRAIAFKADQNAVGRPARGQGFTIAHAAEAYRRGDPWREYDLGWQAHWHEPLASALAAHRRITAPAAFRFAVAMHVPVVRFGMGRRWLRPDTPDAATLAAKALDRRREHLARIDGWHTATIAAAEAAGAPPGALVNELAFVTGGGTALVSRPRGPAPSPLSAPSHLGLLEGFDTGYFYYNTLDLWTYAFPALSLTWPDLAESVFRDYLDSIAAEDPNRRPIYRTETQAPMLAPGKLPHDLGTPAEDPWVRLNGYVMRDDPNLWKDHNPGFIVAFALHRHLTGAPIDAGDYRSLALAADFIAAQDADDDGAPAHADFGDSTWDNLDIQGHSATATGLCLAAWAVLERLAAAHGDTGRAARAAHKRIRAAATLDALWSGTHWRCASAGKYRNAALTDALIGPFYARRMGLGELVDPVRARTHLATVLATNHRAYADGRAGPLLVAEPGRTAYGRDGGEELQVNEVIVGSAWIFAACLRAWGLTAEAAEVAGALDRHARASGLQFRTPAAWTADGRFRAPLNMRPMAIWSLLL